MLQKNWTDTEKHGTENQQNSGIRKKLVLLCIIGSAVVFCTAFALPYFARGPAEFSPTVNRHPEFSGKIQENAAGANLKLMTLNMAHGRKDGSVRFSDRKRNPVPSDDIAEVLKREKPDIVALQEADGPCAWSGNFDHVVSGAKSRVSILDAGRAGENAGIFLWHRHTVGAWFGKSALWHFRHLRLHHPKVLWRSFRNSPAVPQGKSGLFSCILTFPVNLCEKSRYGTWLITSADKIPLIVMGDFNCGWENGESAVAEAARLLNLKVWQKTAQGLETYPHSQPGKRLDWILIANQFDVAEYRVFDHLLSDHLGRCFVIRAGADAKPDRKSER
ncbi:MAG: endonuclease/exonuclease/phosphatase family protein [Desulfobacterales bacterium]